EITLVVQVNGKIRARIAAEPGIDEERAYALAMAEKNVKDFLGDKSIRMRVYVPDKLLNLVV
ncbi:MAG TPA: hypothetical protein VN603_07610, partial [Candidatus Acidoferrales bacterium]|nr:hypothetical protein [Candidatus Acidoferrales bacterium]